MFRSVAVASMLAVAMTAGRASAFAPVAFRSSAASSALNVGSEGMGRMEEIEFKIYPGGRVEQTVRGVKGESCVKLTEELNKVLGEVIYTEPTEEFFEQEVVIDQTLTNTQQDGGSSSSWDGQSTW